MMRVLCWLFWSCAAAPAAPATPPPVAAHTPPAPDRPAEGPPQAAAALAAPPPAAPAAAPPGPPQTAMAFAPPAPRPAPHADAVAKPAAAAVAPAGPAGPPAWRRYAVPAPDALGKPTLTIVIAAMGADAAQSARAVALPGPLPLAWLPDAPHLAEQIAAGTAHGHEAMLDMPMEGLGRPEPGRDTLRTWLPPATNLSRLRAALDRVPDAVGLTPLEGSVAALSVPLMDLVMGELAARRMAFLDGPALPHGVARSRAGAAGVPNVEPGMLIDGEASPAMIRLRLLEAEAIARRDGHAVVVGRARPATLDVLEQYLPTVPARGFVLWPISAVIGAGPAPRPPVRATSSAGEVAIAPAQRSGAE